MRVRRWLLVLTPFLPLVVFSIPHGVTLLPEPRDPWYTQYTTPVWIACAIYVYPVTGFLQILGVQPPSAIHSFGMVLYAGAIAGLLYLLLFRRPPSTALKPTGPHGGPAA